MQTLANAESLFRQVIRKENKPEGLCLQALKFTNTARINEKIWWNMNKWLTGQIFVLKITMMFITFKSSNCNI